jgi:murein DD-endopeptidase MepM/ murein hydrolase activator NlpD
VEILDAHYPTQDIRATRAMKALKPLPDEMATMSALHKTVSPVAFWTEPFAAPTPHCANSSFGVQRLHNGQQTGNYHRGLDLRSPGGTPVRAAAGGVVRVARMFRVHGGTIGIDHGQGVTSHYLHLSRLAAKQGTKVKKGQVVGYVGATGFATGPHLHWGVYVHGTPTDPRPLAPSVKSCPAQ